MKVLAIKRLTAKENLRPEGFKMKEIKDFFASRGIDYEKEVHGEEEGYGYCNGKKIVLRVDPKCLSTLSFHKGEDFNEQGRPEFYLDADFNEYFLCSECGQFHKRSEVNFLSVDCLSSCYAEFLAKDIGSKKIVCYNCMDKYQKDLVYAEAYNGISVWFKKENAYLADGVPVSEETIYTSGGLVYMDSITHKYHLKSKTPYITAKCYCFAGLGDFYFTEDSYRKNPDKFFTCPECGKTFYLPEFHAYTTLEDGSLICNECYRSKYGEVKSQKNNQCSK